MATYTYDQAWEELTDFNRLGWRDMLAEFNWNKEEGRYMTGMLPQHLKAFYQFGVYTGKSMVICLDALQRGEKNIDYVYGFDSFEGLPERTNEERDATLKKHGEYLWSGGDYSTDEFYGVKNSQEFLQGLFDEKFMAETKLIRGFYEDTLNKETVKKYDLQPAAYIDIDVDTYESCVEVLNFIFTENIVETGTILGFDDWGGTPGWENLSDGVSKALYEATEKYKLDIRLVGSLGNTYPHVHTLFVVG